MTIIKVIPLARRADFKSGIIPFSSQASRGDRLRRIIKYIITDITTPVITQMIYLLYEKSSLSLVYRYISGRYFQIFG
jgi:predicted secreted protein